MKFFAALIAAALLAGFSTPAFAVIWTAPAVILNGANERPNPVATSGAGTATVTFDDVTNMLSVSGLINDLSSQTNNAHVHGPGDTNTAAGVLFGISHLTSGTPNNFDGNISGSGNITPGQFFGDLTYINVHTGNFPGGEIRGQIFGSRAIPEPGAWALLSCGAVAAAFYGWRKRAARA